MVIAPNAVPKTHRGVSDAIERSGRLVKWGRIAPPFERCRPKARANHRPAEDKFVPSCAAIQIASLPRMISRGISIRSNWKFATRGYGGAMAPHFSALAALVALVSACSSASTDEDAGQTGTGGIPSTGGTSATGGFSATGGAAPTGGQSSGGTAQVGGALNGSGGETSEEERAAVAVRPAAAAPPERVALRS